MATISDIKKKQDTIDALLELGDFSSDIQDGDNKWVLDSLHHDEYCSIGIVHINEKNLGPCKPHIHYESKEYLICLSGGFILNINGNDVRTLTEGECAVVKPGELHYSRPLLDNTKIAYVCVPADEGMKVLGKA